MEKKVLFTISRQFGSGGREIGKLLAQKLSLPYYDNEIITMAAEKSGIHPNCFKTAESLSISNFMVSSSLAPATSAIYDGTLNDKMFQAQTDSILSIAKQGGGIFVGRCADFILKDIENCIHTFIYAPLPARIARVSARDQIEPHYAADKIKKMDKTRASYYNYYTNRKWGQVQNYHIMLDSSASSPEHAADTILFFAQQNRF